MRGRILRRRDDPLNLIVTENRRRSFWAKVSGHAVAKGGGEIDFQSMTILELYREALKRHYVAKGLQNLVEFGAVICSSKYGEIAPVL